MDSLVPSSTFQEHTIAENTILRLGLYICRLNLIIDLELEAELINGKHILSSIVLFGTGEEGLREEQSGQPESWWHSFGNPFGDEVASFVDVCDP